MQTFFVSWMEHGYLLEKMPGQNPFQKILEIQFLPVKFLQKQFGIAKPGEMQKLDTNCQSRQG